MAHGRWRVVDVHRGRLDIEATRNLPSLAARALATQHKSALVVDSGGMDLPRGIAKALRTVVQLIAGGSLTALTMALVAPLDPFWQGIILGFWTVAVTFAQNTLEAQGRIPVLLPSQPLNATNGDDQIA